MKTLNLILILTLLGISYASSLQIEKVEISEADWPVYILEIERGDGSVLAPGTILFALERPAFEEVTAQIEENKVLEEDYATLDKAYDKLSKAYDKQSTKLFTWRSVALGTTAVTLGIVAGTIAFVLLQGARR